MALPLIKILTRDFRAQLKTFNLALWEKDHTGYHKGSYVTFLALEKPVFKAAKFIVDNCSKDSEFWQNSLMTPQIFLDKDYLRCWNTILSLEKNPRGIALFQNRIYQSTDYIQEEEFKLNVLEFADRERVKYERWHAKFDPEFVKNQKVERTRIPEDVRIFVWRRDEGKCTSCGSREDLEYDHIIPVSKGGNNSIRNIELLCSKCNKSKSDKIQ
jgi:hypothetical protein